MARAKLDVTEVFVVERILPYEGSEILGIYAKLKTAQDRPDVKRWYQRDVSEPVWLSVPDTHDRWDGWLAITRYPIQGK